ncbi:MAG: hypothetical protein ACLGIR_05975 [Actinomycetes bacterium]
MVDLRVDGDLGQFDAHGALELLLLMVEIVEAAVPEDETITMEDLRPGSAVVTVSVKGHEPGDVARLVRDVLNEPARLTRDLRRSLRASFDNWSRYGVSGASFVGDDQVTTYDETTDAAIERSLAQRTEWGELIGELRRLGKTQQGRLTGVVRDRLTGRHIYFDAPAEYQDELRSWLFREVALSGRIDVGADGRPARISAEFIEAEPELVRLTEFASGLDRFDAEAASHALRELRRG